MDFIRQHGNYLTPGKLLNLPSALAVVIRSFIYSVSIYLTLLIIVISLLGILAYLPSHFFPKFLGYDHVVEWVTAWQKPVVDKDEFVKIACPSGQGDCAVTSEVREKQITPWSNRVLLHFCVFAAAVFLGLFLVLAAVFPGILKMLRRFPESSPDRQDHPLGSTPSYRLRIGFQKISGVLLVFFVGFSVLATVPVVEAFISDWIASIGVTGYIRHLGCPGKVAQAYGWDHLVEESMGWRSFFPIGLCGLCLCFPGPRLLFEP